MNHDDESRDSRRWKSRVNWVLIGFIGIAAYFLITEHRAHLDGLLYYLPFLFLAACPLMHLFMHGGHGGHGDHGGNGGERSQGTPQGSQAQGGERKQDTTTHEHHH
jgi:hypothetical protein